MTDHFLPVSAEDLEKRHIDQLDFVYVIGDAYVDHPSFGHAIISRVLESHGFSVGIISQPDWKDPMSPAALGRPRLGFLVSGGNMDSMVNHYTVAKKRRSSDSYTPGGVSGKRPDRAVIVYSNLIRQCYKDVPIIAGGIEASLRRLAHYDYWSDSLRRSILMDCGADLISYGMGERSIVEIAEALDAGIAVKDITFVAGTCFKTKNTDLLDGALMLPSYDELLADKANYASSFYEQYCNTDPINGKQLAERYDTVYVVQNPPSAPLTQEEMDAVYALPYMREPHPSYEAQGGVPAIQEVRFSLVSNRGCFGGCNFCALTFHQGRFLQTRSHASILQEAELMTKDPQFKGYIHDVGGPTANFRHPSCKKQLIRGVCKNRQCLFPKPCPNLEVDHSDYVQLLRSLRKIPGVRKVFVRSGIRFDYVCADPDDTFLEELVMHHISGQLKVAPEHISDHVLSMLGKPEHKVYLSFVKKYEAMNRKLGRDQYLVPYFMSSHPGCTLADAVHLAEYLRDIHHMPEQVQDFYPTPSTISTCMYYTGLDPRTMKKVYVPRDAHEKAMQRALMQYALPQNRALVEEALRRAHREDLIGFGPKCLIRPDRQSAKPSSGDGGKKKPGTGGKKRTIRNIHKKHS
ncbi:MAG: YgiQ family radical SAM protein [Lachnospiraceae bacterium]|nr:YgiQ family radical SAM protein [Lachnospiraceae bacterium]